MQPASGNTGLFDATNKRNGVEEEVRFASVGGTASTGSRASISPTPTTEVGYNYLSSVANDDLVMQELYGPTFAGPAGNTSASAARYGVVNNAGFQAQLAASIQDREIAAYTEWNVWLIPDRLKAIWARRYLGRRAELLPDQLRTVQRPPAVLDRLGHAGT